MLRQIRNRMGAVSIIAACVLFGATTVIADDTRRILPSGKVASWQSQRLQNSLLPPQSPRSVRDNDHDEIRSGVRLGQYVPLSDVLRTIRKQYPGKQLNTRMIGGGNAGPVRYEIKWLTPDGHRLDILADAKTGNIIRVRGL